MKRKKRKRVFADLKIQGGLCLRVAIYWFACHLVTMMTVFGFASLEGPTTATTSVTSFFVPALIVATLFLPLALLDLLVFSNRFAGPLLNFRRRFNDLAEGDATQEIKFRPGDYLNDISDNYNKVRKQMAQNHCQPESEKSNCQEKVIVGGGV